MGSTYYINDSVARVQAGRATCEKGRYRKEICLYGKRHQLGRETDLHYDPLGRHERSRITVYPVVPFRALGRKQVRNLSEDVISLIDGLRVSSKEIIR